MVPIIIFIAGFAAGVGVCRLYDQLKNGQDTRDTRQICSHQQKPSNSVISKTEGRSTSASNLDITLLEPIMKQYGVDISASNCLYILCSQIKSSTYKKLLDDIVEKTTSGESLISFINSVHIDTFTFPESSSSKGVYSIPVSTIDQLLTASTIASNSSDPKLKVELLINAAYSSAVNRLKKNFGTEFSKLIAAYEDGREVQSYYNDLIKEIKISRDFING